MEEMSSESNTDMANCDALLNLTILDPPKYGWSVLGGIRNVCPPHEVCMHLFMVFVHVFILNHFYLLCALLLLLLLRIECEKRIDSFGILG
jgi:hypothetical protein